MPSASPSDKFKGLHMTLRRFAASIWLFPAILTLILIVLTAAQISGSSMGIYHSVFYGNQKDSNLLFNKPLGIRSDEWLVNTQLTLAQTNNNLARVNDNIGNGEDVSLMVDVPYREWSVIFKPHDLPFFVMPFAYAFAFRWWFIGYLLILSVYFFTLQLLPRKRLLATTIGLALFFSPFMQWWYLYGTLGSMYYSLFAAIIFMKLLKPQSKLSSTLWAALLTYVLTCFALILYPPFQIPCALVIGVFAIGYLIEKRIEHSWHQLIKPLGYIASSIALAGLLTGAFLVTRANIVKTVTHTTYPGTRVQESGGYDAIHLFSGHLQFKLQMGSVANKYVVKIPLNQSEASNFVYLVPFLLIPSLLLLVINYRRKRVIDWPLALVSGFYLVLLLWLFVPAIPMLGTITFLKAVPHARLVIGLGLLNIVQLILFIRLYHKQTTQLSRNIWIYQYTVLVLAFEVWLGVLTMNRSVGFIGWGPVLLFAIPVPVVILSLLKRRYVLGLSIYALFMLGMTFHINPVYRGTAILEQTQLSSTIRELASNNNLNWAVDYFILENFVSMNGAHSLSGVYTYPQLDIWKNADPTVTDKVYNRYAHTSFAFDRDPSTANPTHLTLIGQDNMRVATEPCSSFMREQKVGFILTSGKLDDSAKCTNLVATVTYPQLTVYIYHISWPSQQ